MHEIFTWIVSIGADQNDDDDLRLKKSLLVVCSMPFASLGVAWGLMYILLGEPLAGMIPLSYALFSMLSIFYFGLTRRYRFFRFSQLLLILVLPFFLMVTLGGFVNGSTVIIWALICPLGALLFDEPSHAYRWFLAYVGLVVISGLFQSNVGAANNLSYRTLIFFFIINLVGVGSFIFVMVSYFVGQKNIFQEKSESLLLNILPKEIYDLWGDAVNTASRMESHGREGIIQITRSTYELVKDDFVCEPQGTINVKGKGEMEVWYVTG